MKNIVSFSGGKDSTAMLHLMIDKGIPVDEVVFFDTGWEFPEMLDHLLFVQRKAGFQITRLRPAESFNYWMFEKPIRSKKDRPEENIKKGDIYRIGHSWPSPTRRWCTRIKVNTINNHVKQYGFDDVTMYIGFAADELERVDIVSQGAKSYNRVFPLIDFGIDEAEALRYCNRLGYDWGGLYDLFPRVSCYCCPLQSLDELRKLRRHFPSLWKNMLLMDSMRPDSNKGFVKYETVHDLDHRFKFEGQLADLGVPDLLCKRWGCKHKDVLIS